MKRLLSFLIFLILIDSCLAAVIHGTVYDENLEILKNAIVEVDSIPKQRYVAKEGTYSFSLPEGTYTITTKHNNDEAEEEIIISKEGNYVLDLFLFPSFEDEDELLEEMEDVNIGDEYFEGEKTNKTFIILGLVIFLVLVGLVFYFLKSKKPNIKSGIEDMTDEIEKYLDFIKKQGGRTTQKDIRKHFPVSEAKISLIITELEHKGKIEKIRKGRSNIIILKDRQ